jgi:hypothetical protein
MTDDPKPDALTLLAEAAAATLASGADARAIRALADHLCSDARAAERAGRLLGEALGRYASRPEK